MNMLSSPAPASVVPSSRPRKRPPISVCFLIDRLSRAGTESQLLALIRGVDRSRVRPSLVLLDGSDAESQALEPRDCPVLRLGVRSLVGWQALLASVRLARFWHQQHVEVLQTYFLDSTYFGVPLARLCGIPRIIRVRNNLGYWLTPKHRWLGGVVNRWADVLLTNSEAGRQALRRSETSCAGRIAVLENGVDLDRFLSIPLPRRQRGHVLRIGAVANLRPVKNLDLLVEAAARLVRQYPALMFQVAGEGPARPQLEALIAQHRLQDRFLLLGAVADIPAFLARQDIAVLCSRSEGMSNALLEYMAAGRAVIATDVGANASLIRDGIEGRIVPPGQVEPLTAALRDLVEDPEQRIRLATAARARAIADYSREAMCERFMQFYENLRPTSASPTRRRRALAG